MNDYILGVVDIDCSDYYVEFPVQAENGINAMNLFYSNKDKNLEEKLDNWVGLPVLDKISLKIWNGNYITIWKQDEGWLR